MRDPRRAPAPSPLLAIAVLGASLVGASLLSACGAAPPASAPVAATGTTATGTTAAADLPDAPDPALAARVDAALDAAVREQRLVGAVALVARDGRLVYHRAVGLADRERAAPMREDTVFRLASMTKPLTAVAALALVDRGALRLEDPVARYLPDFAPKLADGSAPPITIRHLLTHTSGLGYVFNEPEGEAGPYHRAGVSDGIDAPGRTWAENQRRLAGVPLRRAPGTAFHYSLSIDVLGEVVARAGGATLPEVIARTITQPLGLHDTGFRVVDPARLATPYANQATGAPIAMTDGIAVPFGPARAVFAPSRILDPSSYPSGGAGAIGTARDYLTFLEALRTRRIGLAPETLAAALRDQLAGASPAELGPGVRFGYLSSIVEDPAQAGAALSPGTLTWGGAYGSVWWLDPAAKLSVVLLTNTAFEGMAGRVVQDLQRAVYAR